RMVRAVRAHAGFDVPFFTMQLNKYFAQEDAFSWAAVKEAQRQAALGLENVFLLPTALLSMSDEVHNSARGNVALGEMLAKQVYAALCGGRAYAAPALESVGMRDGCVCLRFTAFGTLTRLNATADRKDFMLSDARGEVEVETVRVSGREITLSSARPLEGKMLVSYGARPEGPVAPIVDEFTYLPIISFYNAEVS
ncbi:MAG: sialate O-acetylesterase, partial [Clostridia bacterium]